MVEARSRPHSTTWEGHPLGQLWAGIDAGKTHHHLVVIDEDGRRLLSRRFANTEEEILDVLAFVLELGDGTPTVWATDLNQGGAALLIGVLIAHGQNLRYIPGRTVHHASRSYRGDGKTDAKDAAIIADQARMRRDLQPVRAGDQIASELRLLGAHRSDLATDKTRAINRMRATMLEYFPALEAAFDYAHKRVALRLLTRYQTHTAIRRAGVSRIGAWLVKQGHRTGATIAAAAVEAAHTQHIQIPVENVAALIVARLASEVLEIEDRIAAVDAEIEARLQQHEQAEILLSVPGFGPTLAAEFIAATGGTANQYDSADRLAGIAGVAPVPRDSGRISGNLHRPKRFDRRLLRACYIAAQTAARCHPESRSYYERKRAEGKRHKQAVLALARRRINVIHALLRDGTTFRTEPLANRR